MTNKLSRDIEIAAALKASRGLVHLAADVLGCTAFEIWSRIGASASVRRAYEKAIGSFIKEVDEGPGRATDVFIVLCTFPLGDGSWESMDKKLCSAAGRRYDKAWTDTAKGKNNRELVWYCKEFEQAVELRKRLSRVRGTNATVREQ